MRDTWRRLSTVLQLLIPMVISKDFKNREHHVSAVLNALLSRNPHSHPLRKGLRHKGERPAHGWDVGVPGALLTARLQSSGSLRVTMSDISRYPVIGQVFPKALSSGNEKGGPHGQSCWDGSPLPSLRACTWLCPHVPPPASLSLRAFLGSHALAALSRAGPRAGGKSRGVHTPPLQQPSAGY